jgi:hypothetical protein
VFTSPRITGALSRADGCISMDWRQRWTDDVFIERFVRRLKFESVHSDMSGTVTDLRAGLTLWIVYNNACRPSDAGRAHT